MSETPLPSGSNDRFEQVIAEILRAEESGHTPDLEHYAASFPDLATRLRDYFHNRRAFERLAPQLAPPPPDTASDADSRPSATDTATMPAAPGWPHIPGYEVLSELGRGGMGVVYHVRQAVPQREVALKVIRGDRLEVLSPPERQQWVSRFRHEAQLVASLGSHAHIVTLYEVSEHAGLPFFTMRLVPGGNLAAQLRPLAAPEAAAARFAQVRHHVGLLARVARAVHRAHLSGVLHRDLKPGNILLDEEGQPLVTDFGLARRLDQTGSMVGIEGTASYMAPEQACGGPGAITVAADVYSLGAILYECLTGTPPFRGENDLRTLSMVLHDDPVPPRRVEPRLARDLEAICLKCLEKEPGRRYGSALALAEDLEAWLNRLPTRARPLTGPARFVRWCRRKPLVATAAATLLLAFAGLLTLGSVSWWQAVALGESDKKFLNEEREKNKNAIAAAEHAQRRADAEREKARQELHDKAWLSFHQALALFEQGDVAVGQHQLADTLALALQCEDADLERVVRMNLAAWDRRLHGLRAMLPHTDIVAAVGFTPDGQSLRTGIGLSADAVRTRRARFGKGYDNPFANLTRTLDGPSLIAWDAQTGKLVHKIPGLPEGRNVPPLNDTNLFLVRGLSIGPDGQLLVARGTAPQQAGMDLGIGRRPLYPGARPASKGNATMIRFTEDAPNKLTLHITRVPDLPASILAMAVSPDGTKVVTGGDDGIAWVWDPERLSRPNGFSDPTMFARSLGNRGFGKGRGQGGIPNLNGRIEVIAFSPDGRLIATGGSRYTVQGFVEFWDAKSGQAVGKPVVTDGSVLALTFSPDGKRLVTASRQRGVHERGGETRLWDVETSQPLGPPSLHSETVNAVAFSPDGRTFATANGDPSGERISGELSVAHGEVQLWDAATSKPLGPPLVHHGAVWSVAFSPDGLTLASGSFDETAQLRDFANADEAGLLHEEPAVEALNATAGALVVRVRGNAVQIRDARTGQPLGPPRTSPGAVIGLGPDGRTAFVRTEKAGQFWNAGTGEAIGASLPLDYRVNDVVFSPDGRLAVTAGLGHLVHVWDTSTGKQLATLKDEKNTLGFAHFHGDGKTVVTAGGMFWSDTAQMWDAATGKPTGPALTHTKPVYINGKDPDGRPVRTPSDKRISVWVRAAVLSPDSRLVLTGCDARGAQLWDAVTGKEVATLRHDGSTRAVAISPDGKTLLTGSEDKTARLWDLTGRQVGPSLSHQAGVDLVAFSPDGALVLTASADGRVRLWDCVTGQPLGPPMVHPNPIQSAAFSADGRTIYTICGREKEDTRIARAWEVPVPARGNPETVQLWVQVRTGSERKGQGPALALDLLEWEKRRDQLAQAQPVVPQRDAAARQRLTTLRCESAAQWKAAAWYLGRLLEREPQDQSLLLRRAQAFTQTGQLKEALTDYAAAKKAGADDTQTWFDRADVNARLGRWLEAVDDLSEAVQRDPKAGVILHRRARAYASLGEWEKAAGDLEKLPDAPAEVYQDYALVLLHLKRQEDYQKASAKWVERRGSTNDTRELAALVWVCSLASDAAGVKTVVSRFNPNGVIGQSDPAILRGVGAGLYRTGKHAEAVWLLRRASLLQRRDAATLLMLALAYQGLEDTEQARNTLREAKRLMDQARRTPDAGEASWQERLTLELLYAEATTKIGSPP
jgi:WD40 repeat protein/serine/threonine protein kinase/tetratricopeptide (TPR) repeat protein